MTKKEPKRQMSEEHRAKLQMRYWERRRAREAGVHLPTRKEEKEAARAAKVPVTEQSVNQLVAEAPLTEGGVRINTPAYFRPDTPVDNVRHPIKFRDTHEQLNQ